MFLLTPSTEGDNSSLSAIAQNEFLHNCLNDRMNNLFLIASSLVFFGGSSSTPGGLPPAIAMAYQCFDRSSGEQIAESNIDITSPAISCITSGGGLQKPSSPPSDPLAAKRALNLARGTAVALNGGLSQYRPSSCMFRTAAGNPCITRADHSGIEFTIPGGQPGWEESGEQPTILTVVLISPDGRAVLGSDQD